jgi:hypothetical protein
MTFCENQDNSSMKKKLENNFQEDIIEIENVDTASEKVKGCAGD